MKRWIVILLLGLLLSGCAPREANVRQTVFCMDTVMDLQIWGENGQAAADELTQLLNALSSQWSAMEQDTVPARLNDGLPLTDAEQAVVDRVCALSQRTDGAFDPRLYSLSCLWGFPTDDYQVPTQAQIDAARMTVQWDFGAALKGYAGDLAVQVLKTQNVPYALLNLGGNVQTYGSKPDASPWQIAIENPDGGEYLGILSVVGTTAVVTSGDYQRYFEKDGVRYHHILDPETGRPADSGLRSVTVICKDGMTADALSTALFVMGMEKGSALWRDSDDFEAVFVTADGRIFATEGASLSGCAYEVISR